jgi:hypothetical protein
MYERSRCTRIPDRGQGVFQFFRPPTVKEKLDLIAAAPLDGTKRKLGRSR